MIGSKYFKPEDWKTYKKGCGARRKLSDEKGQYVLEVIREEVRQYGAGK
jgi:hypothetical protein